MTTTRIEPELVDATRRVVDEVGMERATVERIARAAGVSRVTLHRRGIRRGALMQALIDQVAESYRRCMVPALVAGGTGAERLEAALRALCDAAEPHLATLCGLYDAHAAIFHQVTADGATITRLDYVAPLQRLLIDGVTDGSLRSVDDVAEWSEVLFNSVAWTYIHLRRSHGWSPERACSRTLELVMSGLGHVP